MWDQAVQAVVAALPPVLGGPQVEQQGGPLLEGQLPGTAAHVVKLSNGLNLLQLWDDRTETRFLLVSVATNKSLMMQMGGIYTEE